MKGVQTNLILSADIWTSGLYAVAGDGTTATQQHNVRVRNILLEVVLKLVLPPGSHTINQT